MQIGVLIGMNKNTDIDAEFHRVRELDLDCCQLCCWDMSLYTQENADAVRAASEKYSITVTALWAGWSGPTSEWNFTYGPATLGLVPAAYRAQRLQELQQASDFALKLHVSDVITHVGFLPEVPSDSDFVGTVGALRKLCRFMKTRGQYFLFETGQETPVTLLRTIEAIGTDNVGINLDPANLILYGKANPVDAMDVFGKYVRNTHCKDGNYPTDGIHLGVETPLGEGRVNFPALIQKLLSIGYNGPLVIEREISGEKQTADIKAGRDLLRSILKEVEVQ